MKLTLLLLFLAVLTGIAADTYSQSTKLSLNLENVIIEEVLSRIEDQSRFRFFYNEKIDLDRKVSLEVVNENIVTILDNIFQNEQIHYEIIDNQIILSSTNDSKGASFQQQTISGKVTDSSGAPLPGVTVVVKGTTQGTIADGNGNYSLANVPGDGVLVFSFVGMKTQEITVAGKIVINAVMTEETIGLEEVVAIGYGTIKKSDLTGAVAKAPVEKIKDYATTGFQQALAGQVAGVQIQQNSGEPGMDAIMRIRGVGSITAGNEPLYVVDGFVGKANINTLNVNDIESIEVLKDASAAAIYGSRGSSGVVLITTKKGTSEKVKIEASMYAGVQQLEKKVNILNAQEFVEFVVEARDNAYLDAGGSLNDPMSARPASYRYPAEYKNPSSFGEGTDWQDEIFRTAPIQNYNLSVSGGNEKSQFFISGNYFDQKGIIEGSGYKKYSLRLNNDVKLSERIKIGVNLSTSTSNQDHVESQGHWNQGNVIDEALNIIPVIPVYNEDGSYGSQVTYGWNMPSILNPINIINERSDNRKRLDLLAVSYAEIEIAKGLTFKTNLSTDINYYTAKTYSTTKSEYDGRPAPQPAQATYRTSKYNNVLNENMLTYSNTFDEKHSVNAVAVFSAQKAYSENSYMFATNFPNDLVRTINAGQVTEGNTSASEWTLLSYLARINYSFKDKYLLTSSIRRDGSSRFGSNNKWGTFPSLSLAWRVSKEAFMAEMPAVSELKVKASYGFTGNNSIPNYGSVGLLASQNYVFGPGSGGLVNGLIPSSLSNEDLGWERTKQMNLGLELGIFKNRLFLEFDYYNSKTTDLLLNVPVPAITGFTTGLENIGAVRNTGWEFAITSKNLTGKFRWTTDFNISSNKNKVLALGPEGDIITSFHITKVGYPIGNYYGYVFEGIYNTQEEIDARPHLSTDAPGDPIIRDVSLDGQISADDRTILGDSFPDAFFGMTNNFSYKNFDLSIFFQGVVGQEVFRRDYTWQYLTAGIMNVSKDMLHRWKSPENPGNGKVPRADANTQGYRRQVSTLWVQSGDYLRINNVTLGYNLPVVLVNRLALSSTRIYLQAQNLYTFTSFPGYNPEVSHFDDPLQPGTSWGGYPLARTFTFGINMTF